MGHWSQNRNLEVRTWGVRFYSLESHLSSSIVILAYLNMHVGGGAACRRGLMPKTMPSVSNFS
jgi:hypothetical protein